MAEESKTTETKTEQSGEQKPKTAEELSKDLEALSKAFEQSKAENEKLKAATTNASADASAWKKKYQATMSEQERKDSEMKEQREAELKELAELRRERAISGHKAKLMGLGIDNEIAENMAKAVPEGITIGDDFFNNLKTFIDKRAQSVKTETINGQPGLSAGAPPTAKQLEEAENAKLRRYFGL